MYYENNKREDISNSIEIVPTAPLRWNQHPVISTVLWILGTENRKSPGLPPTSSIDNFRPNQGGLNEYLNKHFEQVDKSRISSDAHGRSGTISGDEYHISVQGDSSTSSIFQSSQMPSSFKMEENKTNSSENVPTEDDDQQLGERTSSSDGTQLYPSISARHQHYGNSNNPYPTYGTPGQGGYYPAQNYNGHGYQPNQTAGYSVEEGNAHQSQNDSFPDASPSPQWGFYVAITPPQQEMYSAIKKDLLTIQQQQQHNTTANATNSAQKAAAGPKR